MARFTDGDRETLIQQVMKPIHSLRWKLEYPLNLEGMTQLEKLAFTKWAARNGLTKEALSMAELKDKGKALVEKGKSTLKGKDWSGAEKKLQEAQSKKRHLLFGRKKHKANSAAAEKGVAAAKGKRMALGKKVGLGAAGGAAALLTAAAVKKALSGRKKDEKGEKK